MYSDLNVTIFKFDNQLVFVQTKRATSFYLNRYSSSSLTHVWVTRRQVINLTSKSDMHLFILNYVLIVKFGIISIIKYEFC